MTSPDGSESCRSGGSSRGGSTSVLFLMVTPARFGYACCCRYQIESEVPPEEQLIVTRGDGVALRQARDGVVETIAGEHDVVGLEEVADNHVKLGLIVVLVVLHLGVLVLFVRALPAIDPPGQWQGIIPVLVGNRAPCRDVPVDPVGDRDPGMRLAVDVDKCQGVEHDADNNKYHDTAHDPLCSCPTAHGFTWRPRSRRGALVHLRPAEAR